MTPLNQVYYFYCKQSIYKDVDYLHEGPNLLRL